MTYISGGLIEAADYNGFANNTPNGNINAIWGVGSGDKGYGQSSTLSTVSVGATVTATQWADLNNRITSIANQTGTTITSRTNPVTGGLIEILNNLGSDLTNCNTNRGSAAASGTISSTWSGNIAKTAATGSGANPWTITWTQTVTFPSADQARYFWNAGGLVRIDMSKNSVGTINDPAWNTFISTVGTIYISGRVNGAAQTIGGTSYTGTTRIGGSGTPTTLASTTGWYGLTPGAAATTLFQLNNAVAPYTGDFVSITGAVNAGSTVLTLTTTWSDPGTGFTSDISGGTDTASPYTSFGTAPAVLARFVPPSTTYLTNTWGTPTVSSSIV
jgi:hypothetical protein